MNEAYTGEKSIDAMSFEELTDHLERTMGEFNELKNATEEALRVHAKGGDATTANILDLTLKEWKAKFESIQDIYRKMAGIQEGQTSLIA